MNDELKVGLLLEVENLSSIPTNETINLKRKAVLDESNLHLFGKKRKNAIKGMKATELHPILRKDSIKFCQDVGLLPKSVKCFCNANMVLAPYDTTKKAFKWFCRRNGHVGKVGLRSGTWFENSSLPLADILWIVYMWVHRYSTRLMIHECGQSISTIVNWSKRCLDVCQTILELKSAPLGGEQKTVEIFNCKFKNTEDSLTDDGLEKWVFCALEQNSPKSLLVFVEDKTSDCILEVFKKYILPGTTLVSFDWSPYKNLAQKDFEYLTRELSVTCYNLSIKAKMGTFMEFQNMVNGHKPLQNLWTKAEYEASFFEKMYRITLSNTPDAYLAFLSDVAGVYKPRDVYVKKESKVTDD